jgi:hypothetical protein
MNPTAKRECGAGQLRLQPEYACYEVLCGGNDIYIMGLGFFEESTAIGAWVLKLAVSLFLRSAPH